MINLKQNKNVNSECTICNDLISIIIPVFNAEKYLDKCLNSVVSQTYCNLEIILVNDGSSDNSAKICDRFAKEDNRITVIHQPNQGVSSSRNNALKIANGKFVMFVDSDDWLETQAISIIYTAQQKQNADLVIASYNYIAKNKTIANKFEDKLTLTNSIIKELPKWYEIINTPWGKLFDKDIIDKYNLKFPNNTKVGEDTVFCLRYIEKTNSVLTLSDVIYNYNISISTNATKKYHPAFDDYMIGICSEMKKIMKNDTNHFLSNFSIVLFKKTTKHYCSHIKKNALLKIKLQQAYTKFKEFFAEDDLLNDTKIFTQKEKEKLLNNEMLGLVSVIKIEKFKSKFSNKILKIKKFFKE